MHGIPNKRRRRGIRNLTMRQARMIMLANAFAGWCNADGTPCRPWPDSRETPLAAQMVRDEAIAAFENGK